MWVTRFDNWIIWNLSPSANGWVNVRVTEAVGKSGVRRSSYTMGYNGERFSRCSDTLRLETNQIDSLLAHLNLIGAMNL